MHKLAKLVELVKMVKLAELFLLDKIHKLAETSTVKLWWLIPLYNDKTFLFFSERQKCQKCQKCHLYGETCFWKSW